MYRVVMIKGLLMVHSAGGKDKVGSRGSTRYVHVRRTLASGTFPQLYKNPIQ